MTIDQDLIDEITAAANQVSAALNVPQAKAGAGKLYELWLLFKLAEALRADGYAVEVRGSDDNPSNDFVQRGSPGQLPSVSASMPKPSFILFQTRHHGRFEIHNSLQFRGRSSTLHEFDISIFRQDVAQWLRRNGGGTPDGHPRFSIECKNYTSNVQLGVARDLLGQFVDGTFLLDHARYYSNTGSCGVNGWKVSEGTTHLSYRAEFQSCFTSIATPSAPASGAANLANFNSFRIYADVDPSTGGLTSFLTDAVGWIRSHYGPP